MKKYILFALTLMLISSVFAHMPSVHLDIWDKGTADPISSDLYTSCIKYPNLCFAGNTLIDIGVYYYYTQGTKYATTHSPSFCKLLLENAPTISGHDIEKMRACAIGGCTHLPADLSSHGPDGLVQYSIKHSFLVNSIVHVFGEQHEANIIESIDPGIKQQEFDFLSSANECEDLYITSMLGTDAFKDMSQEDLKGVYRDFVQEILTSQASSYDPAFREKSFLGELDSIPMAILVVYFIILFIFLAIFILTLIKLLKGDKRVRIFLAILIFGLLCGIMIFFAYTMTQGTTFKNFITLIRPISNLVPIGNVNNYINAGVQNTKDFFIYGETTLEGKDPSGLATNPVLINASKEVLWIDYIVLGIFVLSLIWFAWYVLKKKQSYWGKLCLHQLKGGN